MKYVSSLILFLLPYLIFSQPAVPLPEALVSVIQSRLDAGMNQSIAIGIIDKNGPRYYSFGRKQKKGALIDEHSIYEIGSISKVFTGILLASAAIDGKVQIEHPANEYLPQNVTVPSQNGNHITLGQLSDHTSGLPRLPGNLSPTNPANPYADYSIEQLYEFINGFQLKRNIGAEYVYSNLAQGLLGHILALVDKKSYEELVIEKIAKPLQMEETKITLDRTMKKNLAIGHTNGIKVENWDIPTLAGAGAIRSSVHDMLKFLAANLGMNDHPIFAAMQLSHQIRHHKAGAMRLGLGWHIAEGLEGDVLWHNGGTGGYRAFAGFVRETKRGVVVLTNSTEGVDDIGFFLLNSGSRLRTFKPHIATEVRKAIDERNVEEAVTLYHSLRTNFPDKYDFGETEMNALGYYYMDRDLSAALAIFKLNEAAYPNSFNVYDSYGEALMKNGQTELAIVKYRQSLELNPGNTNGIKMLKRMGVEIKPFELTTDEKILQTYVGKYELSSVFHIQITSENGKLFAKATGQPKFELFASSETEFYLKVAPVRIKFLADSKGKFDGLILYQGGQEMQGRKLE